MAKQNFNFGVANLATNVSRYFVFILSFFIISCATRSNEMTRNLLEGNEAATHGDFASAVVSYEAALHQVPNSPTVRRNLGIVLVKVGNYKRARALLESIISRYDKDLEVRYFLGEASRGLADYAGALSQYQKALAIDSKDLRILKAYAWTYGKIGNYDRALSIVEPLLASHATDLQLRLIAASAYNKLHKYKQTVSILALIEKSGFKLLSRDKVSAEAEKVLIESTLAEAYVGLENCDKGTSLYNDILKTRPLLASALTGLAKCDMKGNALNRAISRLEKASKADPEAPETNYLLARLLEKTDSKKSAFYYRRFLILARDNNEFANEAEVSKNALNNLEKTKEKPSRPARSSKR